MLATQFNEGGIVHIKIILSLLLVFLSAGSCANDWPMFMGNPAHTGQAESNNPSAIKKLTLKWSYNFPSQVVASPVIVGQQLFVAADNGNLYALDMKTQRPIWIFHAQGGLSSTPAVVNGIVYVLSRDGHLYAIKQTDGLVLWSFATLGENYFSAHGMYGWPLNAKPVVDPWDFYLSSPVVQNGKVYFGSSDEHIYSLDAQTGALQWRFKAGGVVHSSPAFADNKIIIGSWDSAIYALDATTGKEVWRHQGKGEQQYSILLGVQASPSIDKDVVYIGSRDGHFYALNLSDGKLRWAYDAQSSWIVGTAVVDDEAVYVGTSDTGLLIALDKTTGKERFRFSSRNWTYASAVLIANRFLAFGTMTGELFIIDKKTTQQQWFFQTAGRKADEFSIIDSTTGKLNTQKIFAKPEALHAALQQVKHLGAFIASPVWANEQLIVINANGQLLVFH
jgi:outer membrane protein assembly factor BamB